MAKLYVVTTGSYSDYSIRAIFSTQEKAQEYIQNGHSSQGYTRDFNDIEEYELDQEVGATHHLVFRAEIELETGKIVREWSYDDYSPAVGSSIEHVWRMGDLNYARVESHEGPEHVLKVAAECRQSWLRKKAIHAK